MLAPRHPSPRVHCGSRPMTPNNIGTSDSGLTALFEDYTSGAIDRRAFMRRAAKLGVAGAAAAALGPFASTDAAALAQQAAGASAKMPLDVAEWSYMWVNVRRAETARGAFVGGQQMY